VSALSLEAAARARLPAEVWQYLAQGDGHASADALRLQPLVPRPLVNFRVGLDADSSGEPDANFNGGGSTALTLFGQALEHPLVLAPVAYQRLFHPAGESASAFAAAALGGQFTFSSLASQPFAQIAQAFRDGQAASAPQPHTPWFQLYWQGSRERSLALLNRALAAGCSAVVFTVDAPVKHLSFTLPAGVDAVNLSPPEAAPPTSGAVFTHWMQAAPVWADVAWLCAQTTLPVLLKGVLHADDAERAVELGCAGVIVSSHGGRVLQATPPTLHALGRIARRVESRFGLTVPVLFDSGVRSGRDAFVALAHGATAVLVGRPAIWGLAADGARGVAQVLRELRDELELTMALCGTPRLRDIGAHCLALPDSAPRRGIDGYFYTF
jgi:4-hydroxymandelate oxidase